MSKDTAHQFLLSVKDCKTRDEESRVIAMKRCIEEIMDWGNESNKDFHLDEALYLVPSGRADGE